MKYRIGINQKEAIASGLDIDLIDVAIIDVLWNFSMKRECEKVIYEGTVYYWFSHQIIVDNLPLARLKKDSIYRRMKAMIDMGIFVAHPKNKEEGKSRYTFTAICEQLYFDTNEYNSTKYSSENNPMLIGSKSEPPSDQNPNYNNIIEKDIKNKKLADSAKAPSVEGVESSSNQCDASQQDTPTETAKKGSGARAKKAKEEKEYKIGYRIRLLVEAFKDDYYWETKDSVAANKMADILSYKIKFEKEKQNPGVDYTPTDEEILDRFQDLLNHLQFLGDFYSKGFGVTLMASKMQQIIDLVNDYKKKNKVVSAPAHHYTDPLLAETAHQKWLREHPEANANPQPIVTPNQEEVVCKSAHEIWLEKHPHLRDKFKQQ